MSIHELLARANALLRRRRQEQAETASFGPFTLDLSSRQLRKDGKDIPLAPKEFDLLALFVKRAHRALTREEILKRVWGYDLIVTDRSVDRCVTTLRQKVEPVPDEPTYIRTIRGIGYRFEPEGGEG
jgi:DNA-binding response OmpR family regulator